ncbi:hypothetical protein [Sphingorhabdus sp. 109]|jgi:hypothetical protein|uniref:hypothetical protein n=1 Tax=Sphingorhabdus sp. 109 TaxID=2653173 RepID=UPI0012F23704|nr:hypothetical protein [Sphingorhabdus sp. 109]VWX55899.1 hypothetical protein SPHINGOR109_10076 [Sphingorhabdus sp. 109]
MDQPGLECLNEAKRVKKLPSNWPETLMQRENIDQNIPFTPSDDGFGGKQIRNPQSETQMLPFQTSHRQGLLAERL